MLRTFHRSVVLLIGGLLLGSCQSDSWNDSQAVAAPITVKRIPAASQTTASSTPSMSKEALYARLRALPDFEQRALVLAVTNRVQENDENLERDTPRQNTDALKIQAVELRTLSQIANAAQWEELATLYDQASQRISGLIRGEISFAKNGVEQEIWLRHYNDAIASFQQAHSKKMRSPSSDDFLALRNDLATYVSAGARIVIWQPGADKEKRARAAGGPPSKWSEATRRTVAHDIMDQQDKANAARDALMAVPKSERVVALMASSGALNRLLDGSLSRAKLDSEQAVSTTRQIGAFTLDQLSDLALRMEFGEIANCHAREALQLRQLAQGRESKPVGCRPKVYPALGKEDIDRLATAGDTATIDRLTKDWAKQTWLSGFMTVTYSQHTEDGQASD